MQDDLRYHVGAATIGGGPQVPVVTLLSHAWGQSFTEEIHGFVGITHPKALNEKGICTDYTVPVGYIDPAEYWPDHEGPITCLLSQAYEPMRMPVVVTEEASTYVPSPGK